MYRAVMPSEIVTGNTRQGSELPISSKPMSTLFRVFSYCALFPKYTNQYSLLPTAPPSSTSDPHLPALSFLPRHHHISNTRRPRRLRKEYEKTPPIPNLRPPHAPIRTTMVHATFQSYGTSIRHIPKRKHICSAGIHRIEFNLTRFMYPTQGNFCLALGRDDR